MMCALAQRQALSHCGAARRRPFSDQPGPMLSGRLPTEKQLQFARDLSTQHSVAMPDGAIACAVQCSAFIDSVLDSNPSKPSEKQMAFARKLAEEKATALPDEAYVDRRATSRFIDEMMGNVSGGSGGGGMGSDGGYSPDATGNEPTPKQLGLIASLCRDLQLGVPAHALMDKKGMSSYIDELMAMKGSAGGTGMGAAGGNDAPMFSSGPTSQQQHDLPPPPARFPY
eukprot:SAG22_NODE_1718_length_3741_cov_6.422021_3_plen_227_part_00